MRTRLATILGTLGFAFVGALAPRIARAQDAGTCNPTCQSGEICVGSTCMVPACRPPCGAGETCVGGTCMVPAAPPPPREPSPPPPPPPPPVVQPLPVTPRPAVRFVPPETDADAAPTTGRHGAYVIGQVGVSAFQEEEARFLSPGLRVGGLAGGYLTNHISLGGGLTFDLMNWDLPPGNHGSGFMLEVAFAPLFHAGDARAEFIVGPAFGGWLTSRNVSDDLGGKATAAGQGWALGGNLGLLVPVRSKVRIGALVNVMFRETVHTCASFGSGVTNCFSSGPTHEVIGFTLAVMR